MGWHSTTKQNKTRAQQHNNNKVVNDLDQSKAMCHSRGLCMRFCIISDTNNAGQRYTGSGQPFAFCWMSFYVMAMRILVGRENMHNNKKELWVESVMKFLIKILPIEKIKQCKLVQVLPKFISFCCSLISCQYISLGLYCIITWFSFVSPTHHLLFGLGCVFHACLGTKTRAKANDNDGMVEELY